MNARKLFVSISLLTLLTLLASACASAAARATPQVAVVEKPVEKEVMIVATAAAAPAARGDADKSGAGPQASTNLPNTAPRSSIRMIIKNGEMTLLVANTDRALDQATGIAVDSGGYIVSSRTWLEDNFKYATLTMGVPSDQFEAVQRQLRTLAVQVLNDTASGQDVSDEYVDLQSRLTNLEATEARIREFLKDAKTVEEALKVNAQLTDVENEIEQIKGRMNYLKDRAAYSTLVITLNPQRPTPTPTLTPTPTPTPTPVYWQPGKTVDAAGNTLNGLLRGLGDMLIWLGIVVLPFAIPVAIIVALVAVFRRKTRKPGRPTPPSNSAG